VANIAAIEVPAVRTD